MCKQKQNHSHTVLKISFRLVLSESDNLGATTCSLHDKSRFHGITRLSFWAYTFPSVVFKFYGQVKGCKFFCKMAKFLLVGYFHFWAKPFSFWAKPFSFWAKRCGRNSLWAKLAITPFPRLLSR